VSGIVDSPPIAGTLTEAGHAVTSDC